MIDNSREGSDKASLTGTGGSEIDAAVAVAAPDDHGDRERENRSQRGPAQGDQHAEMRNSVHGLYLGLRSD